MTELLRQLQRLRRVAAQSGYAEAASFLTRQISDMETTSAERGWPFGRCEWCWIDAKRLREAITISSPGGGPPVCQQHEDEYYS